ncbi:MAG: ATPase [Candidatus Vogelbacteria bacterium CG10_big_fil_rev_8_21_14_0_10_51_16]|uniref:ATPase n=1 Tax=Candidatus Vogelbacteria bacterium CG10_big_fil_rev_8_21_14_0_10_51_16 TaxID=1975045 RepID=A0A2H0RF36_9BACT|nr:MAG: ATPase [Candidatus Vogelbacteria bacterium CG10_big_fil_rev_8_21_14_0_10_51_16]
MHIERSIKSQVLASLSHGKVLLLYGARQVGKTTLVKEVLKTIPFGRYLSCDEPDVRDAFTRQSSTAMKAFIGTASLVVLDEAQRVPDIGITLKLLHDTYPDLRIIATGPSSFDLANSIVEPLTGRNIPFTLFPISYGEFASTVGEIEARRLLEHRVIHGMYPSVIASPAPDQEVKRLCNDYLFKDVLRLDTVRKPLVVEQLARLLAMQVGSEVSVNELAQKLEISRPTILSYIRLLEQAFVIFRLPPLGRNRRNEITRLEKIYFYDTGMRNALLDDFKLLSLRQDAGALFENFFIVERMKWRQLVGTDARHYFWRTKEGSEIDYVEERGNELQAFECKLGGGNINTRAWHNAFPEVPVTQITMETLKQSLK